MIIWSLPQKNYKRRYYYKCLLTTVLILIWMNKLCHHRKFTKLFKLPTWLLIQNIVSQYQNIPRKASTCPATPRTAFKNIRGNICRQECWQGSASLEIANCKNLSVLLTISGRHNCTGFPIQCKKRNQLCATQSLLIDAGTGSSSPSRSSGNVGPYIKSNNLAVNARFVLFHCSTRAILCRQFIHDSLSVFHNGGDGKHRAHATSHVSNRTLSTLSHSWSATSSRTVGGDSNVSFIASRKRSSASHVSRVTTLDSCANCCKVRRTRWHRTACRLIVSAPE